MTMRPANAFTDTGKLRRQTRRVRMRGHVVVLGILVVALCSIVGTAVLAGVGPGLA